jgi:hypothetical protein
MVQATVGNTVGALQIAITVSTMLFGIVTMQCLQYMKRYPDDAPILKTLVRDLLLKFEGGRSSPQLSPIGCSELVNFSCYPRDKYALRQKHLGLWSLDNRSACPI